MYLKGNVIQKVIYIHKYIHIFAVGWGHLDNSIGFNSTGPKRNEWHEPRTEQPAAHNNHRIDLSRIELKRRVE